MDENQKPQTAPAENGTADAQQSAAPPAPNQQELINNAVAKESRKAVEKLLKEAGITPEDNPEMQLKQYKKWLDGQKSDLEKATGSVSALTQERDTALAERAALERKIVILGNGIPAALADKYAKLAEAYSDDSTPFDKALAAALKDFPVAPAGVPGTGSPPPPAKPAPTNMKDKIAQKTEQLLKG